MQQFRQDVTFLGDRVSHVETKLGDCALTVNDLINAYAAHNDEHNWIKDKVADHEDRNNVKIRGISEEVQTQDLSPYVRGLIKIMLPELKNIELVIDHIHRLPKPLYLPDTKAGDVILHKHFFTSKTNSCKKHHYLGSLPEPNTHLQIYTDLLQHTLQKCRQLNNITKALRNHKIPYQWVNPTKLLVIFQGSKQVISSPQESLQHLHTWGLIPEPAPHVSTPPEWRVSSSSHLLLQTH